VFGIENHAGRPVYVHAKICVIDDIWTVVGSDNLNLRSWTHDSELTCAVLTDGSQVDSLGTRLRLMLAAEHLDRSGEETDDLRDPAAMFDAYVDAAGDLDAWYAAGGRGPRPKGRLRPYRVPAVRPWTGRWAQPLYRILYDPDGRPPALRRRRVF
jgi:phosphatidylserine/phosphatidylglycerophosphate/cardiolipin synthase-like enzyme